MMEDWRKGCAALEATILPYRQVSASVAGATQVGSKVQSLHESGMLYDRFAQVAIGADFPREVVEATLQKVTRPEDWALIELLYPKDGIRGFSDWSTYMAEVAEVEEMTLAELVTKLDDAFDTTSLVEFQLQLAGEEARAILRQYAPSIETLYLEHSEERIVPKPPAGTEASAALLRRRRRSASITSLAARSQSDGATNTADPKPLESNTSNREMSLEKFRGVLAGLQVRIGLQLMTDQEATEAYAVCAAVTTHKVTLRSFTVLMAVISTYHTPSPFITLGDKLATFLDAAFGPII